LVCSRIDCRIVNTLPSFSYNVSTAITPKAKKGKREAYAVGQTLRDSITTLTSLTALNSRTLMGSPGLPGR